MKWPWRKKVSATISKVELLGYLPYSKTDPLVFDRTYRLPKDAEVMAVLGSDYSSFEDEDNDCDDYAFRAKGMTAGKGWPFALVWINSSHLLNGWLNDQREWVWLEPQTRQYFTGEVREVNLIIM